MTKNKQLIYDMLNALIEGDESTAKTMVHGYITAKIRDLTEAREDFVATQLGPKIEAAYQKDVGRKPHLTGALEIVNYISHNTDSKYIQWIAKQYTIGAFKLEDCTRMKTELATFDKVKPRLANKDLNSYKTLVDLYAALKPFEDQDVRSAGEQERDLKAGGAEKIIDTADFKVLKLKTKEAACFYGKGTKWCTAADNDNRFDYYASKDDLYVILAGDRKFQLSMRTDSFMNEQDQALTKADITFLSKFPQYKDFLNAMIEKYYK